MAAEVGASAAAQQKIALPPEGADITNIQDEDLLRRMWQATEDFGRKREIRARMYKLREQRLKEFYTTGEVLSDLMQTTLDSSTVAADSSSNNAGVSSTVVKTTRTTYAASESGDSVGGGGLVVTTTETIRGGGGSQESLVIRYRSSGTDDENLKNIEMDRRQLQGSTELIYESGGKTTRSTRSAMSSSNNQSSTMITKSATYGLHSQSLGDQGFLNLKSKEIRDSESPTRDFGHSRHIQQITSSNTRGGPVGSGGYWYEESRSYHSGEDGGDAMQYVSRTGGQQGYSSSSVIEYGDGGATTFRTGENVVASDHREQVSSSKKMEESSSHHQQSSSSSYSYSTSNKSTEDWVQRHQDDESFACRKTQPLQIENVRGGGYDEKHREERIVREIDSTNEATSSQQDQITRTERVTEKSEKESRITQQGVESHSTTEKVDETRGPKQRITHRSKTGELPLEVNVAKQVTTEVTEITSSMPSTATSTPLPDTGPTPDVSSWTVVSGKQNGVCSSTDEFVFRSGSTRTSTTAQDVGQKITSIETTTKEDVTTNIDANKREASPQKTTTTIPTAGKPTPVDSPVKSPTVEVKSIMKQTTTTTTTTQEAPAPSGYYIQTKRISTEVSPTHEAFARSLRASPEKTQSCTRASSKTSIDTNTTILSSPTRIQRTSVTSPTAPSRSPERGSSRPRDKSSPIKQQTPSPSASKEKRKLSSSLTKGVGNKRTATPGASPSASPVRGRSPCSDDEGPRRRSPDKKKPIVTKDGSPSRKSPAKEMKPSIRKTPEKSPAREMPKDLGPQDTSKSPKKPSDTTPTGRRPSKGPKDEKPLGRKFSSDKVSSPMASPMKEKGPDFPKERKPSEDKTSPTSPQRPKDLDLKSRPTPTSKQVTPSSPLDKTPAKPNEKPSESNKRRPSKDSSAEKQKPKSQQTEKPDQPGDEFDVVCEAPESTDITIVTPIAPETQPSMKEPQNTQLTDLDKTDKTKEVEIEKKKVQGLEIERLIRPSAVPDRGPSKEKDIPILPKEKSPEYDSIRKHPISKPADEEEDELPKKPRDDVEKQPLKMKPPRSQDSSPTRKEIQPKKSPATDIPDKERTEAPTNTPTRDFPGRDFPKKSSPSPTRESPSQPSPIGDDQRKESPFPSTDIRRSQSPSRPSSRDSPLREIQREKSPSPSRDMHKYTSLVGESPTRDYLQKRPPSPTDRSPSRKDSPRETSPSTREFQRKTSPSPKRVTPSSDSPSRRSPIPESPKKKSPSPAREAPKAFSPSSRSPTRQSPARDGIRKKSPSPASDSPKTYSPVRKSPARDSPIRDSSRKHSPSPIKDTSGKHPLRDAPRKHSPSPAKDSPTRKSPARESPLRDTPRKASPSPARETAKSPQRDTRTRASPARKSPSRGKPSKERESPCRRHPEDKVYPDKSPSRKLSMKDTPKKESSVRKTPERDTTRKSPARQSPATESPKKAAQDTKKPPSRTSPTKEVPKKDSPVRKTFEVEFPKKPTLTRKSSEKERIIPKKDTTARRSQSTEIPAVTKPAPFKESPRKDESPVRKYPPTDSPTRKSPPQENTRRIPHYTSPARQPGDSPRKDIPMIDLPGNEPLVVEAPCCRHPCDSPTKEPFPKETTIRTPSKEYPASGIPRTMSPARRPLASEPTTQDTPRHKDLKHHPTTVTQEKVAPSIQRRSRSPEKTGIRKQPEEFVPKPGTKPISRIPGRAASTGITPPSPKRQAPTTSIPSYSSPLRRGPKEDRVLVTESPKGTAVRPHPGSKIPESGLRKQGESPIGRKPILSTTTTTTTTTTRRPKKPKKKRPETGTESSEDEESTTESDEEDRPECVEERVTVTEKELRRVSEVFVKDMSSPQHPIQNGTQPDRPVSLSLITTATKTVTSGGEFQQTIDADGNVTTTSYHQPETITMSVSCRNRDGQEEMVTRTVKKTKYPDQPDDEDDIEILEIEGNEFERPPAIEYPFGEELIRHPGKPADLKHAPVACSLKHYTTPSKPMKKDKPQSAPIVGKRPTTESPSTKQPMNGELVKKRLPTTSPSPKHPTTGRKVQPPKTAPVGQTPNDKSPKSLKKPGQISRLPAKQIPKTETKKLTTITGKTLQQQKTSMISSVTRHQTNYITSTVQKSSPRQPIKGFPLHPKQIQLTPKGRIPQKTGKIIPVKDTKKKLPNGRAPYPEEPEDEDTEEEYEGESPITSDVEKMENYISDEENIIERNLTETTTEKKTVPKPREGIPSGLHPSSAVSSPAGIPTSTEIRPISRESTPDAPGRRPRYADRVSEPDDDELYYEEKGTTKITRRDQDVVDKKSVDQFERTITVTMPRLETVNQTYEEEEYERIEMERKRQVKTEQVTDLDEEEPKTDDEIEPATLSVASKVSRFLTASKTAAAPPQPSQPPRKTEPKGTKKPVWEPDDSPKQPKEDEPDVSSFAVKRARDIFETIAKSPSTQEEPRAPTTPKIKTDVLGKASIFESKQVEEVYHERTNQKLRPYFSGSEESLGEEGLPKEKPCTDLTESDEDYYDEPMEQFKESPIGKPFKKETSPAFKPHTEKHKLKESSPSRTFKPQTERDIHKEGSPSRTYKQPEREVPKDDIPRKSSKPLIEKPDSSFPKDKPIDQYDNEPYDEPIDDERPDDKKPKKSAPFEKKPAPQESTDTDATRHRNSFRDEATPSEEEQTPKIKKTSVGSTMGREAFLKRMSKFATTTEEKKTTQIVRQSSKAKPLKQFPATTQTKPNEEEPLRKQPKDRQSPLRKIPTDSTTRRLSREEPDSVRRSPARDSPKSTTDTFTRRPSKDHPRSEMESPRRTPTREVPSRVSESPRRTDTYTRKTSKEIPRADSVSPRRTPIRETQQPEMPRRPSTDTYTRRPSRDHPRGDSESPRRTPTRETPRKDEKQPSSDTKRPSRVESTTKTYDDKPKGSTFTRPSSDRPREEEPLKKFQDGTYTRKPKPLEDDLSQDGPRRSTDTFTRRPSKERESPRRDSPMRDDSPSTGTYTRKTSTTDRFKESSPSPRSSPARDVHPKSKRPEEESPKKPCQDSPKDSVTSTRRRSEPKEEEPKKTGTVADALKPYLRTRTQDYPAEDDKKLKPDSKTPKKLSSSRFETFTKRDSTITKDDTKHLIPTGADRTPKKLSGSRFDTFTKKESATTIKTTDTMVSRTKTTSSSRRSAEREEIVETRSRPGYEEPIPSRKASIPRESPSRTPERPDRRRPGYEEPVPSRKASLPRESPSRTPERIDGRRPGYEEPIPSRKASLPREYSSRTPERTDGRRPGYEEPIPSRKASLPRESSSRTPERTDGRRPGYEEPVPSRKASLPRESPSRTSEKIDRRTPERSERKTPERSTRAPDRSERTPERFERRTPERTDKRTPDKTDRRTPDRRTPDRGGDSPAIFGESARKKPSKDVEDEPVRKAPRPEDEEIEPRTFTRRRPSKEGSPCPDEDIPDQRRRSSAGKFGVVLRQTSSVGSRVEALMSKVEKRSSTTNVMATVTLTPTKRRPSKGPESGLEIEEIYDVELLESMLEKATDYDQRRRIRAQIRIARRGEPVKEPTTRRETPKEKDSTPTRPTTLGSKTTPSAPSAPEEPDVENSRKGKPRRTSQTRESPEKVTTVPTPSLTRKPSRAEEVGGELTSPSVVAKLLPSPSAGTPSATRPSPASSTPKKNSLTSSSGLPREACPTDSITSSYGVGPTDESGRPLFGLRALRRPQQQAPDVPSAPAPSPNTQSREASLEPKSLSPERSDVKDSSGRPLFGLRAITISSTSKTTKEESKVTKRSKSPETAERPRSESPSEDEEDVEARKEMPSTSTTSTTETSVHLRDLVRRHEQHARGNVPSQPVSPAQKPRARLRDSFILSQDEEEVAVERGRSPARPEVQTKEQQPVSKTFPSALPSSLTETGKVISERSCTLKSIIQKHEKIGDTEQTNDKLNRRDSGLGAYTEEEDLVPAKNNYRRSQDYSTSEDEEDYEDEECQDIDNGQRQETTTVKLTSDVVKRPGILKKPKDSEVTETTTTSTSSKIRSQQTASEKSSEYVSLKKDVIERVDDSEEDEVEEVGGKVRSPKSAPGRRSSKDIGDEAHSSSRTTYSSYTTSSSSSSVPRSGGEVVERRRSSNTTPYTVEEFDDDSNDGIDARSPSGSRYAATTTTTVTRRVVSGSESPKMTTTTTTVTRPFGKPEEAEEVVVQETRSSSAKKKFEDSSPSSPATPTTGFSKLARGGSVRALSQKFQQAAGSKTTVGEVVERRTVTSTSRASTTTSQKDDSGSDYLQQIRRRSVENDRGTSPASSRHSAEVTTVSSSRTREQIVDEYDDDDDLAQKRGGMVTVEQRTVVVTNGSTGSQGKSFLGNQSKVTGVQDVLSRMREADNEGPVEGDTVEDSEARALLNKFLGAQVILQGMEPLINAQSPSLVRQVEKQRVQKKQESSTVSIVYSPDLDLEGIWDERRLRQLLESCTDYEGRRKIRARIRTVMAEQKVTAAVVAEGRLEAERESQERSKALVSKQSDDAEMETSTTVLRSVQGHSEATSVSSSTEASVTKTEVHTKTSNYSATVTGKSRVSKAPPSKTMSPFAKFKQLDEQNAGSAPKISK